MWRSFGLCRCKRLYMLHSAHNMPLYAWRFTAGHVTQGASTRVTMLFTALLLFGDLFASTGGVVSQKRVFTSQVGFCGVTEFGGSCDEDESGSWNCLSQHKCLKKCEACTGCSFISFSAENRDCSWFRQCADLDLGEDLGGIGRTYRTQYIKAPGRQRSAAKHSRAQTASVNVTIPDTWFQMRNLDPLLDKEALAECPMTYLDFGSNVGNWVSALFSNRSRIGHLNNVFGSFSSRRKRNICAWGFEPNPSHHKQLRSVQAKLRRHSPHVHFFHAAIASSNGEANFWSDNDYRANEWGSSLLNYTNTMDQKPTAVVQTIGLSWLLDMHVAAHNTRRVVIKMDIEGAEYTVLPNAIESICRTVDVLLLERHDRFFTTRWKAARPGYYASLRYKKRLETLNRVLQHMEDLRSKAMCSTRVLPLSKNE